jgi:hypothetical protein
VRGGAGYAAFASPFTFALWRWCRARARSKGIHVAHLVIDAGVNTAWVRERIKERGRPPANLDQAGGCGRPRSRAYWQIYQEPRDAWSFERDRPRREMVKAQGRAPFDFAAPTPIWRIW